MRKCVCTFCSRRFAEEEAYVGEGLSIFCDWQCYEDYSRARGPADLAVAPGAGYPYNASMRGTAKSTRRKFEARELQTARLEVRLPPALIQALRGEAERAGVSVAWIVKEGLYRALGLPGASA